MLSWDPLKRKVLAKGILESLPCGWFRVLAQDMVAGACDRLWVSYLKGNPGSVKRGDQGPTPSDQLPQAKFCLLVSTISQSSTHNLGPSVENMSLREAFGIQEPLGVQGFEAAEELEEHLASWSQLSS